MLNELIFLGTFIALASVLLAGCTSKKTAPSVAKSPANTPNSPALNTKSPVTKSSMSKSPGKETNADDKQTGDETKKDTKGDDDETNTGTNNGTSTGTTTTDDKKDDKKDENDEKEEKKKSKDKKKDDDEKKGDDEKKKDSDDKDDEKKDEDKESKPKKKKETFISTDPTELCFETATTSQKKLRLKNLTSKKVMFKIKATTTNIYLINPVFGKIEPNNFADVMITHRPSAKREDKLVIMSSEMLGKEIEMAKTFKAIKTTGADVSVKLIAS